MEVGKRQRQHKESKDENVDSRNRRLGRTDHGRHIARDHHHRAQGGDLRACDHHRGSKPARPAHRRGTQHSKPAVRQDAERFAVAVLLLREGDGCQLACATTPSPAADKRQRPDALWQRQERILARREEVERPDRPPSGGQHREAARRHALRLYQRPHAVELPLLVAHGNRSFEARAQLGRRVARPIRRLALLRLPSQARGAGAPLAQIRSSPSATKQPLPDALSDRGSLFFLRIDPQGDAEVRIALGAPEDRRVCRIHVRGKERLGERLGVRSVMRADSTLVARPAERGIQKRRIRRFALPADELRPPHRCLPVIVKLRIVALDDAVVFAHPLLVPYQPLVARLHLVE